MNLALLSLFIPLATGLLVLLVRPRRGAGYCVIVGTFLSLLAAGTALGEVVAGGNQVIGIGGWESPLAIRLNLTPLAAMLTSFTALVHLLVALYAAFSRKGIAADYWPLSSLLHASLVAMWLSADLFNLYVALELLSLTAVALVTLAGPRAYRSALNYLLLSLAGSLCYLLGVAMMYGRYGVLDVMVLGFMAEADAVTEVALILMTAGLMLKAALWPLHLWLPGAHSSAPTPVSALLSGLVVKGPIFVLWTLWTQVAPEEAAYQAGPVLAVAGILALLSGGWAALRSPFVKVLVAFSTVAQLGYAMIALGLLIYWQQPQMHAALWLFVLAHGLAKVSMFLAAGELQSALGSRHVSKLAGATQIAPIAMFAFAVAGGSLIGLPPSGGFLAKWVLLGPMFAEPRHWPWALGIIAGTLMSAAYVFRTVTLGFDRAPEDRPRAESDRVAQWLALVPALLVWSMGFMGEQLIVWLTGVSA